MNRLCSMFSQILKLFPRSEFELLVRETRAERHARGFSSWGQFVAMLFCHLGRAHSLREIYHGVSTCEGKLSHLGIVAPKRSSLAYANEHRPWELYQRLFLVLLDRCQGGGPWGKKFRFKNKLVSLDSSVIDLCVSVFDWAKFCRTKGAIKLHLLRRVEVWNPEKEETPVFVTNNFKLGAVWSALIAMLILRYLQLKSRFGWSLSNLVALLRMNLFTYRDLWAWLDQPFGIPPEAQEEPRQEVLALV